MYEILIIFMFSQT